MDIKVVAVGVLALGMVAFAGINIASKSASSTNAPEAAPTQSQRETKDAFMEDKTGAEDIYSRIDTILAAIEQ